MSARRRKTHNFAAVRAALRSPAPPPRVRRSGGTPWVQFFPPGRVVWAQVELPLAALPPALAGFRFVHLSDLHLRAAWGGAYDDLIGRLAADPPDAVLVTGDIIDHPRETRAALPTVRRLLSGLRSRLGTYAIPGNHDGHLLMPYLLDVGVCLMDGRRTVLRKHEGGAGVELIGLPGPERDDLEPAVVAAFPPRVPGTPRVVLSHYPDLFGPTQSLEADVFLAGHTHGGQVCLPGGRPILTHDRLPKRFSRGAHRLGKTWLVVSRGLGMTGLPLRLFCPAEAMEITLVPEAGDLPAGARLRD